MTGMEEFKRDKDTKKLCREGRAGHGSTALEGKQRNRTWGFRRSTLCLAGSNENSGNKNHKSVTR